MTILNYFIQEWFITLLLLLLLLISIVVWILLSKKASAEVELYTYIDHYNKQKYKVKFNKLTGKYEILNYTLLEATGLDSSMEKVGDVTKTKYYMKDGSVQKDPLYVVESGGKHAFHFLRHIILTLPDSLLYQLVIPFDINKNQQDKPKPFKLKTTQDKITFLAEGIWLMLAETLTLWENYRFTIVYEGYSVDSCGNKTYGKQTVTKSAINTKGKSLDEIYLEVLQNVNRF